MLAEVFTEVLANWFCRWGRGEDVVHSHGGARVGFLAGGDEGRRAGEDGSYLQPANTSENQILIGVLPR